jgi:hypothetical protein
MERTLQIFYKLHVLLFFTLILLAIAGPVIGCSQKNNTPYLLHTLDKVITWSDGTIEHVQIDNDGFFILNGVKKRLIGMVLTTSSFAYDNPFYTRQNMDRYDKELTYLESIGVRLIHTDLRYVRWSASSIDDEKTVYRTLLNLLYRHKMLVIPLITGKGLPNFNNLENPNFSWTVNGKSDSMGSWANRWGRIVGEFQNVVTVVADNELDYPYEAQDLTWIPNATDQKYGPVEVANYLNYLENILSSSLEVPIITKMVGYRWSRPDIKVACLEASSFPSFTCYANTSQAMDGRLDELLSWVAESGYRTTGWWCLELNNGLPIVLELFNVYYVDSVLSHGASVVMLFPSNSTEYDSQFFDINGNPVPKLIEVAQYIEGWQVPYTGTH